MEDVIRLIEHLVKKTHSIDRIDSIISQLNISKDYLLQILDNDRFKDFFQLIQPAKDRNQGSEKIALTLDVSLHK